jgi:hypothetical protein
MRTLHEWHREIKFHFSSLASDHFERWEQVQLSLWRARPVCLSALTSPLAYTRMAKVRMFWAAGRLLSEPARGFSVLALTRGLTPR